MMIPWTVYLNNWLCIFVELLFFCSAPSMGDNKAVKVYQVYSQYWDSNIKPQLHDKKMLKDFIANAFGSDFGVEKNYV